MRIAYFDEAGTAKEKQEPYLVVGGVMIHGDTQWRDIEIALKLIAEAIVPAQIREGFVFRGMHLHGDHKRYKGLLSKDARFQILRELTGLMGRLELPISYGAVDRREIAKRRPDLKVEERTHIAHQIAFNLCVTGFQGGFNRGMYGQGDEVAVCVADKNDAKNRQLHLKQNFSVLRTKGLPQAPLIMLFNFVDALHFASLEESIGLQLADVAAFVIKRHLMGKEDTEEFYKPLEPNLAVYDPASALWPLEEPKHDDSDNQRT
ncbi:MAG: DUF3800 domain-containing protein [Candidatus Binataceae bacterium]